MKSLNDILMSRRSVRTYQKKPVEPAHIESILKSALLSPTSKGRKSRNIIVVDDPATLEALAGSKAHGSSFLAGAPLAFVVTADLDVAAAWIEDSSIASITIEYAAEELGLASCWIQIRGRETEAGGSASEFIKELLGIPGRFEVESIVAVGHAGETVPPRDDEKLRWNSISYNTFPGPYFD